MAEPYRSTRVWVVDFTCDGQASRWLRALPAEVDEPAVASDMSRMLACLYGSRARLQSLHEATAADESQYLRGTPAEAAGLQPTV